MKEKLLQEWKNVYLEQVFRLAYSSIDTILINNASEKKNMREYLQHMTYEEFKSLRKQWLTTGRSMWFITGNVGKDTAKKIVEDSIVALKVKPCPVEMLSDIRPIDLNSDKDHFQRIDFTVEDPSNDNSCIVRYYQLCPQGNDLKNDILN